jgi:hypothetical protein
MKYCIDNSFCPHKKHNGSVIECGSEEYCVFQRPNALAISCPAISDYCVCGYATTKYINGRCSMCGKVKY